LNTEPIAIRIPAEGVLTITTRTRAATTTHVTTTRTTVTVITVAVAGNINLAYGVLLIVHC
jgi:hypothetical protein